MITDNMTDLLNTRKFKVWHFTVSLNRLLLRSPRKENEKFNIDITFADVTSMEISSTIGVIRGITEESTNYKRKKKFTLYCDTGIYTVNAISCVIKKSEMDIFDLPFDI